jgi:hypothetical protein
MADAAVLKTAEGNLIRVRLPSLAPFIRLIMAIKKQKQKDKYRLVPSIVIPLENGMYEEVEKICHEANIRPSTLAINALRYLIQKINSGELVIQKE